jgi:hypothetical protein
MPKEKKVKRHTLVTGATVLFTVLGGAWLGGEASAETIVPAQATFADSAGDKIRSDGLGAYADDELDPNSCVRCYASDKPTGKGFMRTGQHPDHCVLPVGAPARELVLDFSDPVAGFPVPCTYVAGNGVLDACGFNSIPDAKIVAMDPNPFYRGVTASDVNLSLSVSDPPPFPNIGFDFSLEFDNLVPVSGAGLSRTLTAGPGATATLYRYDYSNPRKPKKLFVATYRMPFSVTYTKSQ